MHLTGSFSLEVLRQMLSGLLGHMLLPQNLQGKQIPESPLQLDSVAHSASVHQLNSDQWSPLAWDPPLITCPEPEKLPFIPSL